MTTEILDIVDTAVKIGLGALISGVTTYVVTTKNHKHDMKKITFAEKVNLLQDAVSNLEACAEKIQHAYDDYRSYLNGDNKQVIEDIFKEVTRSASLAKSARSSFLLAGHVDIGNLSIQYLEKIGSIRLAILNKESDLGKDIIPSLNSIKTNILELLPSALEGINS